MASSADADRPGMRREHEVVLLRHDGDATQAGDAAAPGDVRLQHVEAAALDEVLELVDLEVALAAGDAEIGGLPQRGHPLDVAAMERLLHPVDAEVLQRSRHDERVLELPGRLGVPGHEPALVAVDHELETVADALAHRLDDRNVVAPVGAAEAQLHGLEAALRGSARRGRPSHRRCAASRSRRRRGSGRCRPPSIFQTGWPVILPARSQRAMSSGQAATVVEVEVVEDPVVALERQRVLADEQVLVALEAVHARSRRRCPSSPRRSSPARASWRGLSAVACRTTRDRAGRAAGCGG